MIPFVSSTPVPRARPAGEAPEVGTADGDTVGSVDGTTVGNTVGFVVGETVGKMDGDNEGKCDGDAEGKIVGIFEVGTVEGNMVGEYVPVGESVGE